jgi:hypothetical protein
VITGKRVGFDDEVINDSQARLRPWRGECIAIRLVTSSRMMQTNEAQSAVTNSSEPFVLLFPTSLDPISFDFIRVSASIHRALYKTFIEQVGD